MFGRRLSKADARVEAYGTVDELSSFLGLARSTSSDSYVHDHLLSTQKDLVALMGELAVLPEDMNRYVESGKYPLLDETLLSRLDEIVKNLEAKKLRFEGWATPGATQHAAALDMGRSVCRRSERAIVRLMESGVSIRPVIIQYLNRLSDVLWLLARFEENRVLGHTTSGDAGKP